MSDLSPFLRADRWLQQLFQSRAAASGGVIRRKREDIERLVGWGRFTRELERRGYRAIENAGQVIIFCNQERVTIIR
jgi:hypothetical protein